MGMRYFRPLGPVSEAEMQALGKAAAGVATAGGDACIVIPPGVAFGELGGAEVSNPAPASTSRADIAGWCVLAFIAGSFVVRMLA